MKFSDLPALGQPLNDGLFCGLTTTPDGTHHAVVLLPDRTSKLLLWLSAISWAAALNAVLPSRPVAELLFANAKSQFESAWHWTSEEFLGNGSSAWGQFFDDGTQDYGDKSYGGHARAVRLIQLTA